MPVLKTLNSRPFFPLVVNHGGSPLLDPPSPKDEDNSMAATKQSDRVSSINLAVTSLRLGTVEGPLPEQEEDLLSRDSVQLTLPSYFQWDSRIRKLHLTGVVIPALLQRRYPANIQLHLDEISHTEGFSPDAFVDVLSGMPQLQSLSIHFHSTAFSVPSPAGERVILPALTRLNFRGITEYLEDLVARIDAPRLGDIEITFYDHKCDVPKLGEWICRLEMQKLHRQAEILFSEHSVSLSLTQPGAPTCLKVQVFCEPFGEQVYSMIQICSHFSAFLSHVEDVHISTTQPSSGHDNNFEQWLKLIRRFGGAKRFRLVGDHSTNVVRALQLPDERGENVLVALHKLCIREPEPRCAPLREAVLSFMQSHRLSGHCIAVEYDGLWINECHGTGATYCIYSNGIQR
jgi:hypothetical protein